MWKLWFRLNTTFAALMLAALLLVSRFHDRIDARPIVLLGVLGGAVFGIRSYRTLRREQKRQHGHLVALVDKLQPVIDDMARLPWDDLSLFRLAIAEGHNTVEFTTKVGSAADHVYTRLAVLRWMRPVFIERKEILSDDMPSIRFEFTENGQAGLPKLVSAAIARREYFRRQAQEAAAA